ncbi:double-strand break repair protein AddB [Shimia ponticola]|uniref:double-strand break repair protein AddB n=1 Tax=Shimia ponticola TaxID=2582893 RepID=UPI0011BDBC45|nr:double-strand break repair protein AddB [Shimia ponticola]
MFEPQSHPRVFGVAPGIDFPRAVVEGLRQRLAGSAPEAWAKVTIVANSARMRSRIQQVLEETDAALMPRLALVTNLDALHPPLRALPRSTVAPMRRRLDLIDPIRRLLDIAPDMAGRTQAIELADTLAKLIDEMQSEGVPAEALHALDVSDQSGHWQRALKFVQIATDYAADADVIEPEAAQRLRALALAEAWEAAPPHRPILFAGSTGSRGTTALLMQAAARLPQGALILPGFDRHTPDRVWHQLTDPVPQEDHPQYRYADILKALDVPANAVGTWTDDQPPSDARNRLISLSLRPAPVTHYWRKEAQDLGSLVEATKDITWIAAPDPRAEANAIALGLRAAAEEGKTAALISPDRTLTRRVSAALDRWGIIADDSAGVPLPLTAPGRLMLQVADILAKGPAADTLLALLKHPLVATAPDARGPHLLTTRAYELNLRRYGPPFLTSDDISAWANAHDVDAWGSWLKQALFQPEAATLSDHVSRHLNAAEALAQGPVASGKSTLWDTANGRATQAAMQALSELADADDRMDAAEYARIIRAHLSAENVRSVDPTHPNILIWGTLEARVQGADLVILGGLNDGVWPEAAEIDPWLNRALRLQAGLLVPERKIGLAAHDYQQAVSAPKVWITRATKTDEAETIPSRWVNRLTTLLEGLKAQGGQQAMKDMHERGQVWLDQAARLDLIDPVASEKRPAPMPPVAARPRRLTVTEIKTLIRDPYAIYAKHILRLRPLDPLLGEADARMRGTMLHDVMEKFLRAGMATDRDTAQSDLERLGEEILAHVPWPAARRLWQARLRRIAPWFVTTEQGRQTKGSVEAIEVSGEITVPHIDFTLAAKADRIDMTKDGQARLYDYKTGRLPTGSEQKAFDKQLMLETAILENGGFDDLGPVEVDYAGYISLGTNPAEAEAAERDHEDWPRFVSLITAFLDVDHALTSRRAMDRDASFSDYDHLARYGEWAATDAAEPVKLT